MSFYAGEGDYPLVSGSSLASGGTANFVSTSSNSQNSHSIGELMKIFIYLVGVPASTPSSGTVTVSIAGSSGNMPVPVPISVPVVLSFVSGSPLLLVGELTSFDYPVLYVTGVTNNLGVSLTSYTVHVTGHKYS